MKTWIDCRDAKLSDIPALLSQEATGKPKAVLTATQLTALRKQADGNSYLDSVVVLPNFLHYARLLSTGQFKTFLLSPGGFLPAVKGIFAIMLRVLKNPFRAAKQDFWTVAEALLAFDMAQIPAGFHGTILLHDSIGDFSWIFDRNEILKALIQKKKSAQIGILTQQPFKACSLLARTGTKDLFIVTSFTRQNLNDQRTRLLIESTMENNWHWVNNISDFPVELQNQNDFVVPGIETTMRALP